MVDLAEIQTAYYMVAATGVLIAAVFYILNLRNAIRDRRRQTILQKLPAMNRDYHDIYWEVYNLRDWTTRQEWQEKHRNQETISKVMYLMNIYNTVGVLYSEGLMSLDDVVQLYTPNVIIPMWERYAEIFVPGNRFNSFGKPSNPLYWAPLERLYRDMKRSYPEIEGYGRTPEEVQERRKRQEANICWKMIQ